MLEHLFRQQAGRIVAHLTRLLGPAHIDLAEESAQESMLRALQVWPYRGMPANPAAWLFRAAHNAAIDSLRRSRTLGNKTEAIIEALYRDAPESETSEEQLRDDELRMIIMCCHPELSRDASVALSLKSVGGFSVAEIARAFLSDERAVAQRLVRAKRHIRDRGLKMEMPEGPELRQRLDSVLDVLYFMFNEGYSVHDGDTLIRQDLCFEALRLGLRVAASSISEPRVHALVAMMALQAARFPARVDENGDVVLLELQDRSRWLQEFISLGFHHFERCIAGDEISEYHVQAAIAATHARAKDSASTEWALILHLYDQLLTINPSPVIALNRAVAISRVGGPAEALSAIDQLENEMPLRDYYLLHAVRGQLLFDLGRTEEAGVCFRTAMALPCSGPERRFLAKKADLKP